MERTLAIIKPDAVEQGYAGKILDDILGAGFKLLAIRQVHLTQAEAEAFYSVHRERPFFSSLVRFMTSGPCIPMALEKEDAIAGYRALIGATDPAEAADGTVRKKFAQNKERNAVHGSDSVENGQAEIGFFFTAKELLQG
ncbi:MAG: nucleoside-diphosphate kinase [Verrucomicrobiota bacterium]|nr:nucleoside-diphosphate kinase [Verrucomicrobiota bacterium]MDD8047566.1 nucleoside-diphosphate kinase [Verrucomicrobiota bacterium]MDD8050736.1 nucleoside-diphosphate kinase [Verrucomicrobiota bacterium]MDI9382693.1 nucleoside-diphosphate kinase [Verrucomicrobiota bacterium]HCF96847.1 nucleoside-diphosphate kinase [Verrucomicrobiota bacterium]